MEQTVTMQKRKSITIRNEHLRNIQRIYALPTTIIPAISLAVGIGELVIVGISSVEIELLLSMYLLTTVGLTVGFHRHLTHRSFRTNTAVRAILTILGSMAAQGPVLNWVSNHRRHHKYSDQPEDPHSPYLRGEEITGGFRGFWHAHVGWLFDGEITNAAFFSKDLLRDPAITKINQLYLTWVFLGLAIPTVLGGLITSTWIGALQGFLWGGLIRIALVQNATWTIGSLCHIFGTRPFETNEHSKNNIWLAIPILGDSWHNNHHTFPDSAISGLEWWQIDPSGWVIRALEKVGLAWDVKAPTRSMIEAKKKARSVKHLVIPHNQAN
ncbi:MAG: acyl-CoA desaturase [Moorea sp. SIO4A3]|nr:acyl-CoA desaturase [Moorena sp. SIO4A3]